MDDKAGKYTRDIAPLVEQIGRLCNEHGICMVACFSTETGYFGSFYAGPNAPAPATFVGAAITLGVISPDDLIKDALSVRH